MHHCCSVEVQNVGAMHHSHEEAMFMCGRFFALTPSTELHFCAIDHCCDDDLSSCADAKLVTKGDECDSCNDCPVGWHDDVLCFHLALDETNTRESMHSFSTHAGI